METTIPQIEYAVAHPEQSVWIDYTNWRGERAWRQIHPMGGMRFEATQWHPTPGWMFLAYDFKSGEMRQFAMSGVHQWSAKKPAEASVIPTKRVMLACYLGTSGTVVVKHDCADYASALMVCRAAQANKNSSLGDHSMYIIAADEVLPT